MYVFLEKVVLALSVAAILGVWAVDPMKLDVHYKIGITVIFLGVTYLAAHAIYKHNEPKKEADASAAPTTTAKESSGLSGTIEFISVGSDDSGKTVITLVASTRNTGMPTVAESYSLSVRVPGKTEITAMPTHIPGNIILGRDSKSGRIFQGSDALYSKTAQPIPTGGVVNGVVLFIINNVSRDAVNQVGTSVKLNFADVTGKTFFAEYTFTGKEGDIPIYFPGMKQRIIPPEKQRQPKK